MTKKSEKWQDWLPGHLITWRWRSSRLAHQSGMAYALWKATSTCSHHTKRRSWMTTFLKYQPYLPCPHMRAASLDQVNLLSSACTWGTPTLHVHFENSQKDMSSTAFLLEPTRQFGSLSRTLRPQHIFCLRPPAFDKRWTLPRIPHQRCYDSTVSRCVAALKLAHMRMVGSYAGAFRVVKNGRCGAFVDDLSAVSHGQYRQDMTNGWNT